jgi:hypothetical protein
MRQNGRPSGGENTDKVKDQGPQPQIEKPAALASLFGIWVVQRTVEKFSLPA